MKKQMRRLVCLALASVLFLCGMSIPVGAAGGTFSDVPPNAWYYNAVAYAAQKRYVNGMGNNLYDPSGNVTRAQFAQVLYNMEGSQPVSGAVNRFADVPHGAWYENPVVWCNSKGIVNGTSNTTFTPNGNVTRQDLCVMVYRYYTDYLGNKNPAMNSDSQMQAQFADWGAQSGYAGEALRWATKSGFMGGSNGYLNPKSTASRAELAQFLTNLDKNVLKSPTASTPELSGISGYVISDFHRVRNQYAGAQATIGYAQEFTDANGDQCVLSIVYYKIISTYSEITLHNVSRGEYIKDPVDYYGKMANRAYGSAKMKYYQLQEEVLNVSQEMLKAMLDVLETGKNTGIGVYVSPETLNF